MPHVPVPADVPAEAVAAAKAMTPPPVDEAVRKIA